jgi:GNAT superfamily N-acetyltransferase
MSVPVRQLKERDDLSAATQLLQRFFLEEGFETPDEVIALNVRRMACIETCGLFVAETEGRAIGVATVSLEFGIEYGWSAEMGDLYVLPDWRGRGISRLLVEAVEALLVKRGATGYQVTVTPYAAAAHDLSRFYKALGFDDEGRVLLYRRLKRQQ